MTALNDPNGSGRMARADSRALDGALSPEEQARVERERAANPARARAVDSYRDAMALWVEDARREAAALDAERLAERVLLSPAPRGPVTAPWGYAAAAAALIAVGLGGLLTLRPTPLAAPDAYGVTGDVEQDRLAVLRQLELDQLGVEPK